MSETSTETLSPRIEPYLPLLRRVSRSFYLSVRFLPGRIRPTIAIGYLLARASDTIADTNELRAPERLETLELFDFARPDDRFRRLVTACAQAQRDGAEKELLRQVESIFALARALPLAHQDLLSEVLTEITAGQRFDIQRFECCGHGTSLRSREELELYTYRVAGSVGKFWTCLCLQEWKCYSRIAAATLVDLGIQFGKGLQLINILRDSAEDRSRGRSYLPGTDVSVDDSDAAEQSFDFWRHQALLKMQAAWCYLEAVRPARVRFACALPILIGVRTLARLSIKSVRSSTVKVRRLEVYRMLVVAVSIAVCPALLPRFRPRAWNAISPENASALR